MSAQRSLFSTATKKRSKAEPEKAAALPVELTLPQEVTPERKLELAKIYNDDNSDFDTRRPAAEEYARPYVAELEMASAEYDLAAFVFALRYDDGCILTRVFTLNRNAFRMDWVPELDDDKKNEAFFKMKQEARLREVADKALWMGTAMLRHKLEPLGMFCISIDDEDDPENSWNVWRFACASYTPEDQDFLETVGNAFGFAGTGSKPWWSDNWTEIHFWKKDDGTFSFHFAEETD